ncbi:Dynamitin [Gracilaria domingensis]|nr:Dynamitin [Gracilaria domingensis]
MEWVYAPEDDDEPVVYEALPLPPESLQPLDLSSSSFAVEPAVQEEHHDEGEYYGDDDIVEERIPPVKAFEMFAGSVFPIAGADDFSDSIYVESKRLPSKHITFHTAAPRLPASESRSDKLKRLYTEVETLATECTSSPEQPSEPSLPDLTVLRARLQQIEHNLNAELRPNRTIRVTPNKALPLSEVQRSDPHAKQPVTVQMISPNVAVLQALEKRVTAVENALGIPRLDEQSETVPLAPLIEDVQTRLGLITDDSLPQRLKKDAEDIARILQSELRDEMGTEIVRMASVLQKIEKWHAVADSLPIVVQRLRCLKQLQDDAAQFMQCLRVLDKQVDALQKRSQTNNALVEKVRRNLETNIGAVQKNIDVLNSKLSMVAVNEQVGQS